MGEKKEVKEAGEKFDVFKHLPKDQKLAKITYCDYSYITTKDGANVLYQRLNPSKGDRILKKESSIDDYKFEQEMKEVRDMGAEDVLEFLYEISDTWKESDNPIEKIQADLRTMIRTYKEDKFEKIHRYFRIDI